jgi:hypothetical protein
MHGKIATKVRGREIYNIYLQHRTGEVFKKLSMMERDNGGFEAFPL